MLYLGLGDLPRVSSRAGRLPRYYVRKNDKIKDSDAHQRLMIVSARKAKKADWSRVRAVPHHRKTKVLLYQDEAPRENWRIKGRFVSATGESITLVLKDGQTRTVQKQAVRKVLIHRPYVKRWQGWVAVGATFLFVEAAFAGDLDRRGHTTTLPIAASLFLVSGMKGIYIGPPGQRPLPQADKQPGAQDNASGKPEEPLRD